MADKPSRASEYSRDSLELVRSTLLFLATRLGDLNDDLVLVGGLVPSLLIDQARRDAHVGTRDVDLGLALAVLDDERYHELARRLRDAGLEPDVNEKGQTTRQRWRLDQVTVDFLIPPAVAGARGGRPRAWSPISQRSSLPVWISPFGIASVARSMAEPSAARRRRATCGCVAPEPSWY